MYVNCINAGVKFNAISVCIIKDREANVTPGILCGHDFMC